MIQLERLADESVTERNFAKLEQLVPDTGGRTILIRFGVSVATFPAASSRSDVATVSHGMGSTPVSVVLTPLQSASVANPAAYLDAAPSSTQIKFRVRTIDGSSPGSGVTTTVYWVAFG